MRVNTAQRMLILYYGLQATGEDMGIDLGCGQRGMAEQGLHYPQVCTIIEQMAGKGMAQHMRTYGTGRDPRFYGQRFEVFSGTLAR